MAKTTDLYVNVITGHVTMSAANTLTFAEVQVGFNLFQKVGLVIHRLDYIPVRATIAELTTGADQVAMALVSSDTITGLSMNNPEVYDNVYVQANNSGTAANFVDFVKPIQHDFTGFPGGGLLIPPSPLYVAMTSDGLSSAGEMRVRLSFTIKQLRDADYLDLLQTRRAFL